MNILESAMLWGKNNYPDASYAHLCAFANSVAYLVTGASGGYGVLPAICKRIAESEYCFDDDENDIALLEK